MIWSYSCGHGHAEVSRDYSMISTFLTKLNVSNSCEMCSLLDAIVSDSRKSNSKCGTCGARIFSLDLLLKHNNTWIIWSSVVSCYNFAWIPTHMVAPVIGTWVWSFRCNFHLLVICLIFGNLRTCPLDLENWSAPLELELGLQVESNSIWYSMCKKLNMQVNFALYFFR